MAAGCAPGVRDWQCPGVMGSCVGDSDVNRILDTKEFLEAMRMEACRYPGRFPAGAADFCAEILDTMTFDFVRAYQDLADAILGDDCETNDELGSALREIERLQDRESLLVEIEDMLEKAGRRQGGTNDATDDVAAILDEIKRPALTYDL